MTETILKLRATLFPDLPITLRDELLSEYLKITRNYREHRWEPTELDGGKFSEIVYSIIKGYIDNSYPFNASKPRNMVEACKNLENCPNAAVPRSLRIQIPRVLVALYEIRNNRGVGHTGGDVDPNQMDATYVLYSSKWVLSEMIRIFHNTDIKIATNIVESIIERINPLIWEIDGKKRILDPKASYKNKVLLLLYNECGPISVNNLFEWVEHNNVSNFRRDILRPLHKDKMVEFDEINKKVNLSPIGINYVENTLL